MNKTVPTSSFEGTSDAAASCQRLKEKVTTPPHPILPPRIHTYTHAHNPTLPQSAKINPELCSIYYLITYFFSPRIPLLARGCRPPTRPQLRGGAYHTDALASLLQLETAFTQRTAGIRTCIDRNTEKVLEMKSNLVRGGQAAGLPADSP